MFGDKSSALINLYHYEESEGRNVVAFNYFADTRHGTNCIASHNREFCPAISIQSVQEMLEYIDRIEKGGYRLDTIILDECNMFDETLLNACLGIIGKNQRIVIAGLRNSSRGESFPFRKWNKTYKLHLSEEDFSNITMEDLIKHATDNFPMKGARCSHKEFETQCRHYASETQRFTRDGKIAPRNSPLLAIGGSKDLKKYDYYYEPRCSEHFIKPK